MKILEETWLPCPTPTHPAYSLIVTTSGTTTGRLRVRLRDREEGVKTKSELGKLSDS
jgi:hypothetical protein